MSVVGAVCLGGTLLLAGGAVTPSAIRVQGDSACPTPGQVESALVGMVVPATGSATEPDVVALTADATSADGISVSIRLESATGERIAERSLPTGESCAERARTAAVIVAAWEVRLRGGTSPTLPSFSTGSPPSPRSTRSTASTAPAPASELASAPPPSAPPAEGSRSRDVALAIADQPSRPARPAVDLELGGEVLTSVVATDVAPAALIELRVARPGSVFAGALSGIGIDAHSRSVGAGQGRWRRFGGIVDLRSVTRWRPVELELRLGVALTALAVAGQAFPVTQGATLFDPGGVAGLRGRFRLGGLMAWMDATAVFWPRAHNLYVTGDTAASTDLPSVELLLGAGVSVPL